LVCLYFALSKDNNPLIWYEQTGPAGGKGEEKKTGRSKQRRNRKDKPARSGITYLQIVMVNCTENPIYVFPKIELRNLIPNSYRTL
jgi:hypothetical protein